MSATVLEHVTVIDGTGAPPQPDMSVVLSGERIADLYKTGTMPVDPDATVVDASGKFLIPGLWDMHVHTMVPAEFLPLYIANGVTGIREMMGLPYHHGWRSQISSGEMLGPRMVIASKIVDGPGSIFTQFFPDGLVEAADEAGGRDAVRKAVEDDADFVKVYSFLPRSAYFAIAEEARDRGIPFAGHVPDLVTLSEASDAGQHTCEHLVWVLSATSSREREFLEERQSIAAARAAGEDPVRASQRSLAAENRAADSYDGSRAAAVFDVLARNGTWQVPTLSVLRIGTLDESAHDDERLRYLPSGTLERWKQSLSWFQPAPDQETQARRFFERRVELVGAMNSAGVRVLAGTDCGNPFCFPGSGLHDELELLVQAGLTPMEALQSATRDAAECLGKLDTLGTVSVGKIADLVLLEANPLDDIRNTQRIDSVVVGGRLITRPELWELLTGVESAAQRPLTS